MTADPVRATLIALALGAAAAAPLSLATVTPAFAQAERDASAEGFVQSQASRALQILSSGESAAQKKSDFPAFVDQVADVPRITGFVLGKYRRSVTPGQYADFSDAFRNYANGVYESRLGQYRGQGLKVTGSIVRKPGDVVVSSDVTGGAGRPAVVQWRVVRSGSGWRVVDVNVSGVWLALTQQQDFVSTLDNNRGDIGVLTGQLRTQTPR
ncbi:ABC transporter substrate-binding protein [soil metagenome]